MAIYLQLVGATIIDLIIGDPQKLPHPVQAIGRLCTLYEERSRRVCGDPAMAGLSATIAVMGTTLLFFAIGLMLLHRLFPLAEVFVAIMLIASGIACKSLRDHSLSVYRLLVQDAEIDAIRREVGRIVGRDTSELDRDGVIRATVETVAENMVDGITAPLFFAVLFSMLPTAGVLEPVSMAVLGIYLYKAINTMDSMYGYKNDRYIDFGRYAAKTDDLVNFLPARISGILVIAVGMFLGLNYKNGWKMFTRDRLNHASPNSGHAEAAVAGVLGVQLGGPSCYFGQYVDKPTLGDSLRQVQADDILVANRLMVSTSILFLLLFLCFRFMVLGG